jgi:hypothetical protein
LKKDLSGKETNSGIYVENIETYGKEEVWCLEVEEDNSFVLASGISTGNCSARAIDSIDAFPEAMFILLAGCGYGFSIQKHHVKKLPPVLAPNIKGRKKRYLIADSIEGWAAAINNLCQSYFTGSQDIDFDYRDIRAKGTPLKTSGGKAPGPQPLKDCIHGLKKILDSALAERGRGCQLKPIEAHDMICTIADAVLAGGIRRAACISFFSFDDEEMLVSKYNGQLELNPHRHRANNSALLLRHRIKKEEFYSYFDKMVASGTGEPAFYWSNDKDILSNPCQPSWAKVITPEGIREFKDISVGSKIWSKEGWTTVLKKWSTGIKPVFEYRTSSNIFYGTEKHKVISQGEKVPVEEADSIEILSGMFHTDYKIDIQDIMDGLVLGDGRVHKTSNNLVYLIIGDNDSDYFNSEISSLILKERPGLKPKSWEIQTTITPDELPKTFERDVPSRFLFSPNKAVGFLRGLYSANGSIVGGRVTLKASSKKMIVSVQLMLSSLGIRSYITTNHPSKVQFPNGEYLCKESYDLNISSDRQKFFQIIGFLQEYKTEKLSEIIQKTQKREGRLTDAPIQSVSFLREEEVFDITVDNESHTYWTQGCNVSNCGEISLRASGGFCNLTTINAGAVTCQEDFNNFAKAASFIGTLQAAYTDFHFLNDQWKDNAEKEALIGVSITGVASGTLDNLNLKEAAGVVKAENSRVAKLIGINKAARCTCLKPEGTSSLLLGTSSGIHAWHNDYYLRRIRVGKDEATYKFLEINAPELLEDEYFKPNLQAVISIPVKAPDGAKLRTESSIDLLERIKKYNVEWIQEGHRRGSNYNNVSSTLSIRPEEVEEVKKWLWENREFYNGITILPYDNKAYKQSPFEDITKETYDKLSKKLHVLDFSYVYETQDDTNFHGEVACGGGSCEVK